MQPLLALAVRGLIHEGWRWWTRVGKQAYIENSDDLEVSISSTRERGHFLLMPVLHPKMSFVIGGTLTTDFRRAVGAVCMQ
jgi:hypothetical protein